MRTGGTIRRRLSIPVATSPLTTLHLLFAGKQGLGPPNALIARPSAGTTECVTTQITAPSQPVRVARRQPAAAVPHLAAATLSRRIRATSRATDVSTAVSNVGQCPGNFFGVLSIRSLALSAFLEMYRG